MRPLITGPSITTSLDIATCRSELSSTVALTGTKLEQALRRKRSGGYIDCVGMLDVGKHEADRDKLDALLSAMAAEFPGLSVDQRPLGVVSCCQLGAPYTLHICDLAGEIVEHFESFRPMPVIFERARALAMHAAYCFVEVYPNTLRAISGDGTVSVIET